MSKTRSKRVELGRVALRFVLHGISLSDDDTHRLLDIPGSEEVYSGHPSDDPYVMFCFDDAAGLTFRRITMIRQEIHRALGLGDIEEPQGTPHCWVDGPDGSRYHCAVCGISRCNDHDYFHTCESWILHRAEMIKNAYRTSPLPVLDTEPGAWRRFEKRRSND